MSAAVKDSHCSRTSKLLKKKKKEKQQQEIGNEVVVSSLHHHHTNSVLPFSLAPLSQTEQPGFLDYLKKYLGVTTEVSLNAPDPVYEKLSSGGKAEYDLRKELMVALATDRYRYQTTEMHREQKDAAGLLSTIGGFLNHPDRILTAVSDFKRSTWQMVNFWKPADTSEAAYVPLEAYQDSIYSFGNGTMFFDWKGPLNPQLKELDRKFGIARQIYDQRVDNYMQELLAIPKHKEALTTAPISTRKFQLLDILEHVQDFAAIASDQFDIIETEANRLLQDEEKKPYDYPVTTTAVAKDGAGADALKYEAGAAFSQAFMDSDRRREEFKRVIRITKELKNIAASHVQLILRRLQWKTSAKDFEELLVQLYKVHDFNKELWLNALDDRNQGVYEGYLYPFMEKASLLYNRAMDTYTGTKFIAGLFGSDSTIALLLYEFDIIGNALLVFFFAAKFMAFPFFHRVLFHHVIKPALRMATIGSVIYKHRQELPAKEQQQRLIEEKVVPTTQLLLQAVTDTIQQAKEEKLPVPQEIEVMAKAVVTIVPGRRLQLDFFKPTGNGPVW
jgi:hypothetical protein